MNAVWAQILERIEQRQTIEHLAELGADEHLPVGEAGLGRGWCRVCRRSFPLRAEGTVRAHPSADKLARCPGSRRLPMKAAGPS